ncbi:Ser/Thr and Tyr protein phosphatase [Planctomycetales bacterium 10988]|nr:Ser/Thr and Tyr protein phosphatase [Planctomycetales bacterium 10988]
MRLGISFSLLGCIWLIVAWQLGWWGLPLVWVGISFLLVGLGYLGLGPVMFAKGKTGKLPKWSMVLMLPFLGFTWICWWALVRWHHEEAYHEIAEGIFLGRRAFPWEIPAEVQTIVDLTTEFPSSSGVNEGRAYLTLPTLDGSIPKVEPYRKLVKELAEGTDCLYIHCAQGHGRSAAVAAGVLIARGLASNAAEAEKMMKAIRAGVSLNKQQRRFVERAMAPEIEAFARAKRAEEAEPQPATA